MTGKERHWKAGQTITVLSVYVKEAGQQDTLNSALIGQTIQNQPKSTAVFECVIHGRVNLSSVS